MNILDGKWTLLIIRDLLNGRKRFGELRSSISNISPKVLTDRLRFLEEKQVVNKTVYPEVPPKVEYELTELGKQLHPLIEAMRVWGSNL
jgi:DNA-binding HxlR family transcriptional regulator